MATTPLAPNNIGHLNFAPGATNFNSGITATAGGGQTNAVLLTAQFNDIATVASGNDSVKLPPVTVTPNVLGSIVNAIPVIIANAGANSLQVFGSGTDTINNVATGTGVAVGAGKTAIFYPSEMSGSVGNWYMILSA